MPYPARLLTEGEEVVTEFKPHWRLLFIPAMQVLVAIAAAIAGWIFIPEAIINWIITGVAVLAIVWWGVRQFIKWWFTSYILTNERLIRRAGVIARRGIEIPLENINDMQFSQTVLERILRGGDLLIESAGEHGQSRFRDIREPELFQSQLYKAREARVAALESGSTGPVDVTAQLEALGRLHRDGVLNDEEFAEKKRDLLDRM